MVRWILAVLVAVAIGCAHVEKPPQEVGLAIWDIEPLFVGVPPESMPPKEFLANEMVRAAEEVGGFRVVERERLLKVLEELHLGSSELAEENTRLRLGKLVGARYMLFSSYQAVAGRLRFDLRLVDVETGVVKAAVHKTMPLGQWEDSLRAIYKLTQDLLSKGR